MTFFDFEKKMIDYPVFTSSEVKNIFFGEKNLLSQISFWEKKGHIRKLRKGVYALVNSAREINPLAFASKIYDPSYVSLEYALYHYGIIPDVAWVYTSVTTRKPVKFSNDYGSYYYQKIKPELFIGYRPLVEKNVSFNLATPEKAIMDYIYFNKNKLVPKFDFWQELRIYEEFKFNKKMIEEYKKIFSDKKVSISIDSLLEYQKNAR